MITIEIGNSYSQIKGMSASQEKEIRKALSYLPNPQAAYFSGGFNRPKYLIDKKGYFPSGLLYLVKQTISDAVIVDIRVKPKSTPGMFKLNTSIKPYNWQLRATANALQSGRAGIQACTGSGKSLVIALIAARLNVKCLVIVPSLEIKKQLQESIIEWFGVNKNIVVENIDSTRLKTLKGFSCLIIDEAHHSGAKTYRDLNKNAWNDIYYRVFLTATFYRNADHEKLLFEGIAGQVLYKLTYKEAVANSYIVPVEAFSIGVTKKENDCYSWSQVYSQLVVHNDARNKLIGALLERLDSLALPTLCLIKEIAHGSLLSGLTGIPFANGQDDESRDYIRQFNNGGIKALIGTVGILGEGIDTRPAEYIIIAGLGKAKSAFMQNVGRGLRKYPGKDSAKVIIFKDSSHKFTLRHYKAQEKILLDEFGITPVKLDIE